MSSTGGYHDDETVTVLMTVYDGEEPRPFDAALNSIWAQTRPAEEVILVLDGPVRDELNEVVDRHEAAHPAELRVIRNPVNQGSGPASNTGFENVTTDWVARLDSDDIAVPERLGKQLVYARRHGLDVVGTALAEFDGEQVALGADPEEAILGIRRLPQKHRAIRRYAKLNSPVNHPSALIRTEKLRDAGGYRRVPFMEDYDLWVRLLSAGARFGNMPEPLTLFRAGDSQLSRRTGSRMWRSEKMMQKILVQEGIVGKPRSVANLFIRTGFRMLPTNLLRKTYALVFRRGTRNG